MKKQLFSGKLKLQKINVARLNQLIAGDIGCLSEDDTLCQGTTNCFSLRCETKEANGENCTSSITTTIPVSQNNDCFE